MSKKSAFAEDGLVRQYARRLVGDLEGVAVLLPVHLSLGDFVQRC